MVLHKIHSQPGATCRLNPPLDHSVLKCLWSEKLSFKQTVTFKRTLKIINTNVSQFFHISLCFEIFSINYKMQMNDIWPLMWKIGLDRATQCLWWADFEANWRPSWKDHTKLGVCKQIILRGFQNRFRMQPICSLRQL